LSAASRQPQQYGIGDIRDQTKTAHGKSADQRLLPFITIAFGFLDAGWSVTA
jgi:hypothetical protein